MLDFAEAADGRSRLACQVRVNRGCDGLVVEVPAEQRGLESPELRRRCQAGLNKSEARHALAQAVFVHKQGRIADRTLQNQEHRASGLNLVIAAIALWNTLYMQRAVEHLRERDVAAPDELLAHLSPMSWAHVGLTGDYLWAEAATAGGLRPLNDPADRLYRAA